MAFATVQYGFVNVSTSVQWSYLSHIYDVFTEDQFVKEEVLVVYGKSSSTVFHLAPGKIDERVHSVLENENLNYDKMEKAWKGQINDLENEMSQRTIKVCFPKVTDECDIPLMDTPSLLLTPLSLIHTLLSNAHTSL